MRKPMMAGNWKMNKTFSEAQELAKAINGAVEPYNNVDRVICPSFVALPGVAWALSGGELLLGAQNVHWAESGAYTGEVSISMLKGMVTHVIPLSDWRNGFRTVLDRKGSGAIKVAFDCQA